MQGAVQHLVGSVERLQVTRAAHRLYVQARVVHRQRSLVRKRLGEANLLPPMREALRAMATVGEVCGVMRDVFGMYKPRR